MKSCYQLIKRITKFENYKTRHQFYVFMKKNPQLFYFEEPITLELSFLYEVGGYRFLWL